MRCTYERPTFHRGEPFYEMCHEPAYYRFTVIHRRGEDGKPLHHTVCIAHLGYALEQTHRSKDEPAIQVWRIADEPTATDR